jgi:peptidoglycan/xylan/chitin deacetylase (PgdA/CDA1 family)
MYGVLLPAPDIGNCTTEMRAVADAGFECGIHTWDHVVWHDNVRQRGKDWTCSQMQQAQQKFQQIFGHTSNARSCWLANE